MANVLCGWKPEWSQALDLALRRGGHDLTMAPLDTTDPAAFDAVIPLALSDQGHLDSHRAAGRTVRGLWPSRFVRLLCDDKLRFNRRLVREGFATHVPRIYRHPPRDAAVYPLILKPRKGAFGRGCVILHSQAEARQHRELFLGETHFLQAYVTGSEEAATHMVLKDGQCLFVATAIYRTGDSPVVRGSDHPIPVARWTRDQTPHYDLFRAMLTAIGFTDGFCALNWRSGPDGPMLFEINPRVGASMTGHIDEAMPAYLAAVSA